MVERIKLRKVCKEGNKGWNEGSKEIGEKISMEEKDVKKRK